MQQRLLIMESRNHTCDMGSECRGIHQRQIYNVSIDLTCYSASRTEHQRKLSTKVKNAQNSNSGVPVLPVHSKCSHLW